MRFRPPSRLGVPVPRVAALALVAQATAAQATATAFFSTASSAGGPLRPAAKVVATTSVPCSSLMEIVVHCALLAGFAERAMVADTAYFENSEGLEVLVIVTPVSGVTRMVVMQTGSRPVDGRHVRPASVRPLSDAVERAVRSIYPLAEFSYSNA